MVSARMVDWDLPARHSIHYQPFSQTHVKLFSLCTKFPFSRRSQGCLDGPRLSESEGRSPILGEKRVPSRTADDEIVEKERNMADLRREEKVPDSYDSQWEQAIGMGGKYQVDTALFEGCSMDSKKCSRVPASLYISKVYSTC